MRWQIRVAQYGLNAAGILAFGYCAMVYFERCFFQIRENRSFQQKLVQPPAAPKAFIEPGQVLGRLEIPRLAVSVMVVEGVSERDLKKAAGHVPGTALLRHAGNVGIAAHRDAFFRPLSRIQKSDLLILSMPEGDYRYRVASTNVVFPEAVQVLLPTANDSLTLVTCFPFDYIGAAPKRFIVRAERVQEQMPYQRERVIDHPARQFARQEFSFRFVDLLLS